MGFYISFSGIVTFRNAEQLRDAARYVPLDRLLVETDSPYLAPVPHRGKENQPAMVRDVAEYMAVLKGVPLEQLAQQTTKISPACSTLTPPACNLLIFYYFKARN
jgi:TatD DNase family protein